MPPVLEADVACIHRIAAKVSSRKPVSKIHRYFVRDVRMASNGRGDAPRQIMNGAYVVPKQLPLEKEKWKKGPDLRKGCG